MYIIVLSWRQRDWTAFKKEGDRSVHFYTFPAGVRALGGYKLFDREAAKERGVSRWRLTFAKYLYGRFFPLNDKIELGLYGYSQSKNTQL